jgi:hypothetical protein
VNREGTSRADPGLTRPRARARRSVAHAVSNGGVGSGHRLDLERRRVPHRGFWVANRTTRVAVADDQPLDGATSSGGVGCRGDWDVPRGLYSLRDHDGTVVGYERFSCAPGPAGWRYNAQVLAPDGRSPTGLVDVTTDASGQQIRVQVRAGGWVVRGGVAGGETVWVRTGASGEDTGQDTAPAAGFTGRSPGVPRRAHAAARASRRGVVAPTAGRPHRSGARAASGRCGLGKHGEGAQHDGHPPLGAREPQAGWTV